MALASDHRALDLRAAASTWQLRSSEESARIVLVEDRADCAAHVVLALHEAARGEFDVVLAERLDLAIQSLEFDSFDAMLVDLGPSDRDHLPTIEAVSLVAKRLPVVLLAGAQDAPASIATRHDEAAGAAAQSCFERAGLSSTILRAIRRHRRVGPVGGELVVCRVPNS